MTDDKPSKPTKKTAKKAPARLRTTDSPAARRERDAAAGKAEPEVEFVEEPGRTYGRKRGPGEHNAIIASAAQIDMQDKRSVAALRRRRQAWQTEAWDYYDEVPEAGATVDFAGNLLSKLRLFAATRVDTQDAPVPVDDEEAGVDPTTAKICIETLRRLSSAQGGQAALQRDITINFDVAGECYLHAHLDPETGEEEWNIRSVDELVVQSDMFGLRMGLDNNAVVKIPPEDLVVRLWQRHPRFSQLAMSAMRRQVAEMESLLLLGREIRAVAKSRLSAGLLLVPQELSFGPKDPTRDQSDGEETDDPFDDELLDTLISPITDEGSAAAVAPGVVRGPAEFLKPEVFRLLTFGRAMDEGLDKRIEGRVMRLARGLNMPVEVTTGLQETTFANAAQVKKSEWDSYGEPRAVLMCDALTAGYYQPALEAAGIAPEVARDLFIWFDPTDCIAAPDPTDNAEKAHEDGVISDEARRRYQGYSEADAPEPIEVLRRMVTSGTISDPNLLAQILVMTGMAPGLEVPEASSSAPPVTAAAARSAATRLGQRLVAIDRELRTRLRVAADQAMNRALEKAGNRANSRAQGDATAAAVAASADCADRICATLGPTLIASLGLTDQELLERAFDRLAVDFDQQVTQAQEDAIRLVNTALANQGRTTIDPHVLETLRHRQAVLRVEAWRLFNSKLLALAARRLYDPTAITAAPRPRIITGEEDVVLRIPASYVREALAVAGGDDVAEQEGAVVGLLDDKPVGGVAAGSDILALLTDQGAGIQGYVWDYGSAPRKSPFEPHRQLDGAEFVAFDEPVLANTEGWPPVPYFFPGDHDGCVCDMIPTILLPES